MHPSPTPGKKSSSIDDEQYQYLKKEIKSARNGMGGVLIAGFALGRTCQVFSRLPGSCGGMLQFAWMAGVTIQIFYFFGHVETYGRVDATPFEWLIAAQAVLWTAGIVMPCKQAIPMKHLGRGILTRFLPTWNSVQVGIISDIVVCVGLIALFQGLGSPVQAAWYQVMAGWIALCHACVLLRNGRYRLRLRAAKRRAKSWRKDVRGRHHL